MRLYDKKLSKKDKDDLHKLLRHFRIQAEISNDKDAYMVLKIYNDELNRVLPKLKTKLGLMKNDE